MTIKKNLTIIILLFITILDAKAENEIKTQYAFLDPSNNGQTFEGFGVSLCWWANMCGNWNEDCIDEIIDWLVSPEGLNYRVFRYNIGGGDDPENRNCDPHHMEKGKGKRAEMEGFKDSQDGPYIWERDAAQRKILLKIKEKRPDAVFEAFSNSCPWWMTYSGCCAGNISNSDDNLMPEFYREFAKYLIDVCKHYEEEYGIKFKTLAPFNEPEWCGWQVNGTQEGCNFSMQSQIEFIKILADEITKSNVDIKIAAPDISFSSLYKKDFEAYNDAGIVDLINKWNVHTYDVKTSHRTQLDMLCTQKNIPIWVSETGPQWTDDVPSRNRKGIAGNLLMVKRLIDDFKYLRPTAWLDWQYIEERSDQWCLVRSKGFSEENIEKLKNYHIRSHFSKFIKEGYRILTTLNKNTLAAQSPNRDELVMVMVNTDSIPLEYNVDLSSYISIDNNIQAYITSNSHDMEVFNGYHLDGKKLLFSIPSESIITYVVSIDLEEDSSQVALEDGTYLIYPRIAEEMVLTANDSCIRFDNLNLTSSQEWNIMRSEDGYYLINQEKRKAIMSETGDLIFSDDINDKSQLLQIIPVDNKYYKIKNNSEDRYLMSETWQPTTKTRVVFDEITSTTNTKAQWGFVKIKNNSSTGVSRIENDTDDINIYSTQEGLLTIIIPYDWRANVKVYNTIGSIIYKGQISHTKNYIPLPSGIYIVIVESDNLKRSSKLMIR